MGVRFPSIGSTTFVGPLPATAAETIVCTLPPLNISLDFSQVFLLWTFSITAGTGTTGVIFQMRRGTALTGAIVGGVAFTATIAAGNNGTFTGVFLDTPGAIAAQQYVLTIQQTGATAAGVANATALLAFSL